MESHLDIKRAGKPSLERSVTTLTISFLFHFQKICGACSTNGWVRLAFGGTSAFCCERNRPSLIAPPCKLPGIDGEKHIWKKSCAL